MTNQVDFENLTELKSGEQPPGVWVEVNGRRQWSGLSSWVTRHGSAVCQWIFGRPSRLRGVMLPSGETAELWNVESLLPDFRWRLENADGTFTYGDVVLNEKTPVFIPSGVVPRHWRGDTEHESSKPDLEADLLKSDLAKILCADDNFANDLYAGLCNVTWIHSSGVEWDCSWRYAGGIIADIRGRGEIYLDFYCSGNEGIVTDAVAELMSKLGWAPEPSNDKDADIIPELDRGL